MGKTAPSSGRVGRCCVHLRTAINQLSRWQPSLHLRCERLAGGERGNRAVWHRLEDKTCSSEASVAKTAAFATSCEEELLVAVAHRSDEGSELLEAFGALVPQSIFRCTLSHCHEWLNHQTAGHALLPK